MTKTQGFNGSISFLCLFFVKTAWGSVAILILHLKYGSILHQMRQRMQSYVMSHAVNAKKKKVIWYLTKESLISLYKSSFTIGNIIEWRQSESLRIFLKGSFWNFLSKRQHYFNLYFCVFSKNHIYPRKLHCKLLDIAMVLLQCCQNHHVDQMTYICI